MIEEITTARYETLDKSGNCILKFHSMTCGPYKIPGYVLKDIDKKDPDFRICQAEFNENEARRESLGVRGFPTLLFHDCREMFRQEWLKKKPAIVAEIDRLTAR